MPLVASMAVREIVALLTYHPLDPRVPETMAELMGGVVSMATFRD